LTNKTEKTIQGYPTELPAASENRWLHEALGLAEGDTPFPWQEELLAWFRSGTIDRALDIPTTSRRSTERRSSRFHGENSVAQLKEEV
jgi:hypothetical protein